MNSTSQASPRSLARVTGVVYLLYFLLAIVGEVFIRQAGVTGISTQPDNAAATANLIVSHESELRLGWAINLASTACYGALTALLYDLFKPVDQRVALIAAVFSLIAVAVQAFGSVFQLAPLVILGGAPYLRTFTTEQLQSLALLMLNLRALAGTVQLGVFALWMLMLAYLIYHSRFLPRALAALIAVAGVGWLVWLAPPLVEPLMNYIEVVGFLAEASLMLWLLVKGVNAEPWTAAVAEARA